MAATNTDITIEQGATFSQNFDVTATSGKTYEAKLCNMDWQEVDDFTVATVDADTISLTYPAADTELLVVPPGFSWRDYSGQYGWYYIEETTTADSTIARMYYGKVTLHRKKAY